MISGAIDGHWHQVLNQLAGVGIAWAISVVGTLVLLFVVDKLVGLRVSGRTKPKASISRSTTRKATTSPPRQLTWVLGTPHLPRSVWQMWDATDLGYPILSRTLRKDG